MAVPIKAAQLAALLPDHQPVFRPAIETIDGEGGLHRFGNMTLSRLPVLQIANHLLPWPGAGAVRSMRRHALEVTVQAAFGPLRIVNTHLEYYSAASAKRRSTRLLDLQEEASTSPKAIGFPARRAVWKPDAGGVEPAVRRFQFRRLGSAACAAASIVAARTELSRRMDDLPPGPAASPTCGLYDHVQWKDGPDCRDFIFVTEDLAGRIRRIEVDGKTDASDHQPVLIELAD